MDEEMITLYVREESTTSFEVPLSVWQRFADDIDSVDLQDWADVYVSNMDSETFIGTVAGEEHLNLYG